MMRASGDYDDDEEEKSYYHGPPGTDDGASLVAPPKPHRPTPRPRIGDTASVAPPHKSQRPQKYRGGGDLASLAPPSKPPRGPVATPRTGREAIPAATMTPHETGEDGVSFLTVPTYFAGNYDDDSTVGAMTTESELVGRHDRHPQEDHDGDVEAPSSMADMDYSMYDLSLGGTEFTDTSRPLRSFRTDPQIVNLALSQVNKSQPNEDQEQSLTKPRRGLRLIEQVVLLALIFIVTFLAVYFYALGKR